MFDVDGTLFDTNYLHTLAWSRAFATLVNGRSSWVFRCNPNHEV